MNEEASQREQEEYAQFEAEFSSPFIEERLYFKSLI